MIPVDHLVLLSLLQFSVGLAGLLLRRSGVVVLVAGLVMLNGVLLLFGGALAHADQGPPSAILLLLAFSALGLGGAAVVYAFHRFRKMVEMDDQGGLKH